MFISQPLSRLFAVAVVTLISVNGFAAATPWGAIVTGDQSEAERLATVDLQRYLAQVTGKMPHVMTAAEWARRPVPAVVTGTPGNNALLEGFPFDWSQAGTQGYVLSGFTLHGVRVAIAAANTSEGAVNGQYGLLRRLGYGFYLGDESAPATLPEQLDDTPQCHRPSRDIRGVLPWYNFFNSPTAWDPIDHRAFVDQLLRMGANFVGFHTYDSEPFAAYAGPDGAMKLGEPLVNTATPTWGSKAVSSRDFAFGTDLFYGADYFGAESTLTGATRDEAIRAQQAILRDALDYARRRGLHTCIGFEFSGDPFDAATRDVFTERLACLLDTYPAVEYVWIWQPEMVGAFGHWNGSKTMDAYELGRSDAFSRIIHAQAGDPAFFDKTAAGAQSRAREGARFEQFAQLAYRVLARRTPQPRLVLSGWGGDDRLLSAEYYEGLDKLLPKDVVFASLDFINPKPRVDRIYHDLPPDRERWPIPWLEWDGDQWHAQPYVHTYELLVRDVEQSGSQGLLGIHWRTRDIAENLAFLVDSAWQRGLTADAFFADMAARMYPSRIAAHMAEIHKRLDMLGYRWVGAYGQMEYGAFSWGPGDPGKIVALKTLREETAALLPLADRATPRIQWLLGRMDWTLAYQDVETRAVEANKLLEQAKSASPEHARALGKEAMALLDDAIFATALRAYAANVSTRGEYGVLATINAKAVPAWRELQAAARQLAGDASAPTAAPWQPVPAILLPRFHASAEAGRPLMLEPVTMGGGSAWMHYRHMGDRRWRTLALTPVRGWVQRAAIPAEQVISPGVEVAFSFSKRVKAPFALGPVFVSVMPPPQNMTPARKVVPATTPTLTLAATTGKHALIELTWNMAPEADYFKVYRDGTLTAETAAPYYPDTIPNATNIYTVEAWRDGAPLVASPPLTVPMPCLPPLGPCPLEAFTNRAGVFFRLPAQQAYPAVTYQVERQGLPHGTRQNAGEFMPSAVAESLCRDTPPAGRWRYTVTPIDYARRKAPPFTVTVDYALGPPPAPILDLPLTTAPPAETSAPVAFTPDGAQFSGGHIVIPHTPHFDLDRPITISFSFQADSTSGIPVILSHGFWRVDGWYIQVLDGRLTVCTPSGNVVGPTVPIGVWHDVRCVYDMAMLRLCVNGQWTEKAIEGVVPANRPLIIGAYAPGDPLYSPTVFRGTIRNLRIYPDALPQ